FMIFLGGLEAGATPDHVIDLILMMRPLQVRRSRGQNIHPGAHCRHPEEFAIGVSTSLALKANFGNEGEERFHAKIPPKISSVNCGIRFCACSSPSGLYH